METTSSFVNNTNMLLIIAGLALCLAIAAMAILFYVLASIKKHRKIQTKPSDTATMAKELAEKIDKEFDIRCKEIALAVLEEDRLSQQKSTTDAGSPAIQKQKEQQIETLPKATIYTSSHMFGEYSEMDRGFAVEDMRYDRSPRSQVEIRTITPEKAEFSILEDVDSSLISGLKACCMVDKGDWMDFRTIKTISNGSLELKGEVWVPVNKALVVLE